MSLENDDSMESEMSTTEEVAQPEPLPALVRRGRPPKPKVTEIVIPTMMQAEIEDTNVSDVIEEEVIIEAVEDEPDEENIEPKGESDDNSNSSVKSVSDVSSPTPPPIEKLTDYESDGGEANPVTEESPSAKEDEIPSTSSKVKNISVPRRGSIASRTRMPTRAKRRSMRLKKTLTLKIGQSTTEPLPPRRGRPQKCLVRLNKIKLHVLPVMVGQGAEIRDEENSENSDDEVEDNANFSSATGSSYHHLYYNNYVDDRMSRRSSKNSEEDDENRDGDNESNGSNVDMKEETEVVDDDDDTLSDSEDHPGRKRVRAAAAAAMEIVAKKRVEEISERDRERAERRNRKPYIKPYVPKGRSRRTTVFKRGASKKPTKGCKMMTNLVTEQSLFYYGTYFQEGDIVYLLGHDDKIYFCQLRSISRDENWEPVGSLLWLTPKEWFCGPRFPFAPSNYDIRDDKEEHVRNFNCIHFVMHCPLDYWYGHELNYFTILPGTIYQRLGEPLVRTVKLPPKDPNCKQEQTKKADIKLRRKREDDSDDDDESNDDFNSSTRPTMEDDSESEAELAEENNHAENHEELMDESESDTENQSKPNSKESISDNEVETNTQTQDFEAPDKNMELKAGFDYKSDTNIEENESCDNEIIEIMKTEGH